MDLIDCGEGELCSAELLVGESHNGEARPKRLVLDVAAQPDRVLPQELLNQRVQLDGVRRHGHRKIGPVAAADRDLGAVEVEDVGILAEVRGVFRHLGLVDQIPVDKQHVGVEPHHQLPVHQRREHVSLAVPGCRVTHGSELDGHHILAASASSSPAAAAAAARHPRAHWHDVQVPVPVLQHALALKRRAEAIKGDGDDLEEVCDWLGCLLARGGVEDSHQLRVAVVHQNRHV